MSKLAAEFDVLKSVAPIALSLMESHEATRKLWFPSELLGDAKPVTLHPKDLSVFVLNLLTEEGLPSFHRLLALHLGEDGVWRTWTDLWTAEEGRHGAAMHDATKFITNLDPVVVEQMQFAYLRQGAFRPMWGGSPYELLAYTVLQEKATQISQANIGKALKGTFPSPVCARIAGEEWKHCCFYRSVYKELLRVDPRRALEALEKTIRNFYMPGKAIPGFEDLAYIAMRTRIFDGLHYAGIVEETIDYLGLNKSLDLDGESEKLRVKILRLPAILNRTALMASRIEARSITLPFVRGESTISI